MNNFDFREGGKNQKTEASKVGSPSPESVDGLSFADVVKVADTVAAAKYPLSPMVQMHDQLGQVFDTIVKEESDPVLKNSWEHGVNLRAVGDMYIETGDLADGRTSLKAAVEVMHQAKDKPKDAELTITESLNAYGQSLLMAPGRQIPADRLKDLNNAETIFSAVVERAKLENRSPEDIASMYELKANTEIGLSGFASADDAGQKPAYVLDMRNAQSSLNSGIEKLSGVHDNDATMIAGRLHAEQAYVDTQLNSNDHNHWYNKIWGASLIGQGQYDVASDYKKAIDEFHAYKPDSDYDRAERDKHLLAVLRRYVALNAAEGRTDAQASTELSNMQGLFLEKKK